MLNAGRLRHRIRIEHLVNMEDSAGEVQNESGELEQEWVTLAEVWAAIDPLSAKEFVAAQSEQSKVVARITIRYRTDLDASMRIYHAAKGLYYNIEGILSDKDSGLEYLTLPVSEGVRYEV